MDDRTTSSPEAPPPHLTGSATRFAFGVFEVDLSTGELKRSGHRVRLQSQPFKVLEALVKKPGELVSRQELQQKIWGSETIVDFEHCLGNAIKKVRDAIGDAAENPRFIETMAGRGYRFIAPVTPLNNSANTSLHPQNVATDIVGVSRVPPVSNRTVRGRQTVLRLANPNLAWFVVCLCSAIFFGVFLFFLRLVNKPGSFPLRITQVTINGEIFPQGFRSPESLSPLAVDRGLIFSSSLDQSHVILVHTELDTGQSQRVRLPADVQEPELNDISPDGTKLLLRSHSDVELQEADQPLWVVPTNGASAFRLGDILSHDATWSPDGKDILYAKGTRLETVVAAGGPSKFVAELHGRAFWLRWSPDGERLRFTVIDLRTHMNSLWELRRNEHIAHRLSFGLNALNNVCCGTWTSDGRYFVLQSTQQDNSDLWEFKGNSTSGGRQITNGPLNYTSPAAVRGEQIVFEGMDPVAPVEEREFDPSGKEFVQRTDFLQDAVRITFSLDHQWVAWVDVRGHLWCARSDGSEKLQLTGGSFLVMNCSWSPDNSKLAIMAKYPNHSWKVFWIDRSGGEPQPVLPPHKQDIGDPTFSPDGKHLAFGGLPILMGGRSSSTTPIWVLDLDSKRVEALPESTGLFSPRWSPDGRYIAALTLDQQKLMLYDIARTSWKVAATMPASDPLWSPDGKSLYFHGSISGSRPIYKVSIPDLKVRETFRPDCGRHLCLLSGITPDDRPLVCVDMTRSNIYTMDLGNN